MSACGNCKFFFRNAVLSGRTSFVGNCQRFPPMVYYDPYCADGLGGPEERWPTVLDDMWCGEYKRARKGGTDASTQAP